MKPDEAIEDIIRNLCKVDGAYYYAARRSGIGENECNMLHALDRGREYSQHQLSSELMIPKTTVNTVVKALMGKGLIAARDGEGKEKLLFLTEEGRKEAGRILSPIYEAERRAMERTLEKYDESFIEAFRYLSDALCDEIGKTGKDQFSGGRT